MGVADERREGCDGCNRSIAVGRLRTVSMPNGNSIACCPQCEPHARAAIKKLVELDTRRGDCDGCLAEFKPRTLEDVVLTDGTVVTICPDCLREVPGRAGNADRGRDVAGEKTEIAGRKSLCSQCHEWFDDELYQVTLLDDRSETLCESCKASAEAEGIVIDVQTRRTEAREILDVEPGADEDTVRRAYLTQIKNAHPDRNTGSREAFRLVQAAYDRLT